MKPSVGAAFAAYLALVVLPTFAQAQQIGFYQWVGISPSDTDADLLTEARERIGDQGAFRLYLGARFDYERPYLAPDRFANLDTVTPASILTLPRYRAVLDDPKLSTVILTTYTTHDYGGGPDDLNLLRPWTDFERKTETTQITALCELLYRDFGDQQRTIIIANNEADEKLLEILNYTGDPTQALETLTAWINTRHDAISKVRAAHPNAKLKLFHAFEISMVRLRAAPVRDEYMKSSSGKGWNALEHIVPDIRCDLISYSSYESINSPYDTLRTDLPPELVATRLRADLDLIRDKSRDSISDAGRRAFGDRFVMIGEMGFARERFEPLSTGGVLPRLNYALAAARDWGAPWIILWQVFDAPKLGSRAWGWGAFDAAGKRPGLKAVPGACNTVATCALAAVESRP